MSELAIKGSAEIAEKMHHWHIGMDAVYGVGSMWFAGCSARRDQVEIAVQLLRPCQHMPLSSDDRAELDLIISYLNEKLNE